MSTALSESGAVTEPLKPGIIKGWAILTWASWVVLAWMTCFWVPSDVSQGVAQRIFYYHVPTAWVSFLGFAISLVYSVLYLRKRNLRHDSLAAAYAIAGWVFTTGVIITGPLWAKPIWGDFWNWSDQRLISFFILWLAYAGYLLMRTGMPDPHKRARFSAVLAIVAFIDVPLVYLAIRIWNTPSHPAAVIGGDEKSGLYDPRMGIAFLTAMIAFQLIFFLTAYLLYRTLEGERKTAENPN